MKLRLVIRAAAAADIEDAYTWYERRQVGLGEQFLTALGATLDRVVERPAQYAAVYRDTRRALVRRFPYAVFYRVDAERVLVVACFHAKRDPLVWQSRG